MICTFIGHKDSPSSIKPELKATINNLISEGVKTFYVGNNGNFDYMVQSILMEMKLKEYDIDFFVAISYIGEKSICANQQHTVYPYGLEKTPPRFAISKRNDWLVSKSQIIVVYVKNHFSNSHKWFQKAKKKGLRIINLFHSDMQ